MSITELKWVVLTINRFNMFGINYTLFSERDTLRVYIESDTDTQLLRLYFTSNGLTLMVLEGKEVKKRIESRDINFICSFFKNKIKE